ncbi:MAG: methyltransferase domain-containing protein [Acidimicrobiia bacterium]|nr:methyltransferase domain-containing protein [Acidimicrobiia bacterium]
MARSHVARRSDDARNVARVLTTQAETQANYDRIARFYEPLEGIWERRVRSAGVAALHVGPGESVLEIGSGPGYILADFGRMAGPDGVAVGIDLSSKMCRLAHRRLSVDSQTVGVVVQGDGGRLPFDDGPFDAVFMSFTLELFDTPQIAVVVAETYRILRPGGRITVVSLRKEDPAPLMQRGYEWGHSAFPKLLDCRPIRVGQALTEAGFRIEVDQRLSMWGLPVALVVGSRPAS